MKEKTKEAEVIIFHSNDVHSRLENAAKIATIINEERKKVGNDKVIALDIGDHMDRMRMETEGTDGLIHAALLDQLRYDAITLGNNEGLTFSQQQLKEVYEGNHSFKVVCANIVSHDKEQPEWLHPNTIITCNGIRFGIIGATAHFNNFYQLMNWTTLDPLDVIEKQVCILRDQVDIIVIMSHLGIRIDEEMASSIDGIDLILGAHTHHLLETPLYINNTTICAAGKFGEYVGKVQIFFDAVTKKYHIEAQCIPTAAYPEHHDARAIIEKYSSQAKLQLSRVITMLSEPLPASDESEVVISNLLAEGLRQWCDAEIGLVNSGQLLGGLAAGEVTASELHAICPSPINPCRMRLQGKDIRRALEESLLYEYRELKLKGFGFRGEKLGRLAVRGLDIRVELGRPAMHKIVEILINGELFDDEKIYTVGTIDMFSFRIGYTSLADFEEVQFYLPEFIRHILEFELLKQESIENAKYSCWKSAK